MDENLLVIGVNVSFSYGDSHNDKFVPSWNFPLTPVTHSAFKWTQEYRKMKESEWSQGE